MSPREHLEFVNKYKGFIDKYIGDVIMSMFSKSPADAVNSSVEMQKELEELKEV